MLSRCTGCGGQGALNSISAFANSPCFSECAQLVKSNQTGQAPKVGIHLNIFEGRPVADVGTVPLLVDAEGVFKLHFADLVKASFSPSRKTLGMQLATELSAQIERFLAAFPECRDRLRIDSHQHFHMVPLAFAAVLDAAVCCEARIEHLRIPAEPLSPYLATPAIWRFVRPINLVKALTLKALWQRDKRLFPEAPEKSALFAGVVMSGRMHHVCTKSLLERLVKKAEREGRGLELLFHPGGLDQVDGSFCKPATEFEAFYCSKDRTREAEALSAYEGLLSSW